MREFSSLAREKTGCAENAGQANAAKFCQALFGVAPEGLNAIDMAPVSGKFIVVMVDAVMLIASITNQS